MITLRVPDGETATIDIASSVPRPELLKDLTRPTPARLR